MKNHATEFSRKIVFSPNSNATNQLQVGEQLILRRDYRLAIFCSSNVAAQCYLVRQRSRNLNILGKKTHNFSPWFELYRTLRLGLQHNSMKLFKFRKILTMQAKCLAGLSRKNASNIEIKTSSFKN